MSTDELGAVHPLEPEVETTLLDVVVAVEEALAVPGLPSRRYLLAVARRGWERSATALSARIAVCAFLEPLGFYLGPAG